MLDKSLLDSHNFHFKSSACFFDIMSPQVFRKVRFSTDPCGMLKRFTLASFKAGFV